MEATLVKITALVYLAATASFFYFVLRKDTAAKLPSLVLLAGFLFHTLALVARFMNEGFAAVAFMGEALLFKSWLMVGVYSLVQFKYPLSVLGCIIAPLALLMTLAALAFGSNAGEVSPGVENFLVAVARDAWRFSVTRCLPSPLA